MEYCSVCIMPNSRPGIVLDSQGVCNACRWHISKHTIDWSHRLKEFASIASWARQMSNGPWDCVLGVSGGKDSTWQALVLREVFGLRPLLVQYSCSEGTSLGRVNLENLVRLGFPLVSFHPSPEISRSLSKKSFVNYGNIVKYTECCLFPIPFRVAMAHEIPLVLFGENPALECGDVNSSGNGWDATTIRFNNTLAGGRLDPWLGDGISEKDILPYAFPEDSEFKLWGGRGVFMGYYLNWSGYRNAIIAQQYGFECRKEPPEEIGDIYRHNSLDFEFVPVNSMLKHIKLGFGHTTEFVCYDIRAGRVARPEAIALARYFDGRCSSGIIRDYCRWIDISEHDFWGVVQRYYGPMWRQGSTGGWELIAPIWEREQGHETADVRAIVQRISTERVVAQAPKLPLLESDIDGFNRWINSL